MIGRVFSVQRGRNLKSSTTKRANTYVRVGLWPRVGCFANVS